MKKSVILLGIILLSVGTLYALDAATDSTPKSSTAGSNTTALPVKSVPYTGVAAQKANVYKVNAEFAARVAALEKENERLRKLLREYGINPDVKNLAPWQTNISFLPDAATALWKSFGDWDSETDVQHKSHTRKFDIEAVEKFDNKTVVLKTSIRNVTVRERVVYIEVDLGPLGRRAFKTNLTVEQGAKINLNTEATIMSTLLYSRVVTNPGLFVDAIVRDESLAKIMADRKGFDTLFHIVEPVDVTIRNN